MNSIQELHEERRRRLAEARHYLDRAERNKRPLSNDELLKFNRLDADVERLGAAIEEARDATMQAIARPRPEWLSLLPRTGPVAERAKDDYRERFGRYLTGGCHARDYLGMQVAKDDKGGVAAPVAFVERVVKFLDDNVLMRELATVLPPFPEAKSIGVPGWDIDWDDGDWATEVPQSDLEDNDAARTSKREFCPHFLVKFIKASWKLLRSGMLGLEQLLAERLGRVLKVAEEKAFLTGDGVGKPLGAFVASPSGISTGRDVVCASQTAFTGDELINALFTLKESYHPNATWLGCREFHKRARLLKDGNGAYLWQPGLVPGMPDTILGKPARMSEFAPSTFEAGQYVGLVGDFRAGYWIGDTLLLEIQRLDELLVKRNQIGFIARKETDGAPVVEEAFARIKLAP